MLSHVKMAGLNARLNCKPLLERWGSVPSFPRADFITHGLCKDHNQSSVSLPTFHRTATPAFSYNKMLNRHAIVAMVYTNFVK
jgi:hypothetical protein